MALSFIEIQRAVVRLMFADPQALLTTGLERLSAVYDAYPVQVGKESVYILIKRGLSPRKAGALTEREAVANVLVLEKDGGRWRRAWPHSEPEAVAKVG